MAVQRSGVSYMGTPATAAGTTGTASDPAGLFGLADHFEPGTGARLALDGGQVVAYRPLGQEQPPGDLARWRPRGGDTQHLGLADGQRVAAAGHGTYRQGRVDHP